MNFRRLKSKQKELTSEQDIIAACIDNDQNAQSILFEKYAGKMLMICARYCLNIDDAKDALHEGFIKVFRLLGKFKGNSTLETWITRLMINTSIDHFKKNVKFVHFDNDDDIHSLSDSDETYELELDEEEEIKMADLLKIVNELPDGYRIVFNLYAIEGYTHKEIANQLGISEGTSKSQLARARALLKKMLKQQYNIG
ncbi:MAG: RNA polymerase sigma factor (sigma-70 family) [Bacteroidia bacterium]